MNCPLLRGPSGLSGLLDLSGRSDLSDLSDLFNLSDLALRCSICTPYSVPLTRKEMLGLGHSSNLFSPSVHHLGPGLPASLAQPPDFLHPECIVDLLSHHQLGDYSAGKPVMICWFCRKSTTLHQPRICPSPSSLRFGPGFLQVFPFFLFLIHTLVFCISYSVFTYELPTVVPGPSVLVSLHHSVLLLHAKPGNTTLPLVQVRTAKITAVSNDSLYQAERNIDPMHFQTPSK